MQVIQIQRRPGSSQYSVESYFERVRACLSGSVSAISAVAPCFSRGVSGRVANLWWALQFRNRLAHVTGDVNYLVLALKRRRCVLTVLDCEVLERLAGIRRWIVWLLWFRLPVCRAAVVTVISEETKRQLLMHVTVPADRVVVVPVSVAEELQYRSAEFRAECPVVLQVGVKHNKNVPRLIEALSGLSCILKVVGEVDSELRQLLENSGLQYVVLGRLTNAELVRAYEDCDVVAFCSTHEGFGMPIVEAQRVGRVCVTANCSSMPEVAGGAACLVDPFSVESMRHGFLRVFSDEAYRSGLIEAGLRNAERFNAEQISALFAQIYSIVEECSSLKLSRGEWDSLLRLRCRSLT